MSIAAVNTCMIVVVVVVVVVVSDSSADVNATSSVDPKGTGYEAAVSKIEN